MRIAYAGMPGAFGELACLARYPGCEPIGVPDFRTACNAVTAQDCALALIPFENSIAGPVPGVAQLLAGQPLERIGEHAQPVTFHCLAPRGVALADVRTVVSHPMGLAECRRFLARVGAVGEEAGDTAGAASRVARAAPGTRAALASQRAAQLYGLEVLEGDVQDSADNITHFAILRAA